jgi:hypothetical protein
MNEILSFQNTDGETGDDTVVYSIFPEAVSFESGAPETAGTVGNDIGNNMLLAYTLDSSACMPETHSLRLAC